MNPTNYINHVCFVLDASSSMEHHRHKLPGIVDSLIAKLAAQSKAMGQETRASVYTFADPDKIECSYFDTDIARLPSMHGVYKPYGNTALRDAVLRAIDDLKSIPQIHGDHSFLMYVLTDGQENRSRHTNNEFVSAIKGLPGNFTIAALVASVMDAHTVRNQGFPAGNVEVWDPNAPNAIEEVSDRIYVASSNYYGARSKGIRSVSNLFTLDPTGITPIQIRNVATEKSFGQYRIYEVPTNESPAIAPFIERKTGVQYVVGSAYYQITKPENIQGAKRLCLLEKKTHKVFTGDEVRMLLKLPSYSVRVTPAMHPDYDIFVQSTSVNRKLMPGTKVLVF